MTGCSLRPAGAAPAPGTAGGDAAHAATTTAVGRRMLFAFKTYVMCVYIYIYIHIIVTYSFRRYQVHQSQLSQFIVIIPYVCIQI